MTDEELLKATSAARGAAHRAPLAEVYEINRDGKPTGVKRISEHTTAFADRSHEFMKLAEECRRRGLKLLPCDCPPGSHE